MYTSIRHENSKKKVEIHTLKEMNLIFKTYNKHASNSFVLIKESTKKRKNISGFHIYIHIHTHTHTHAHTISFMAFILLTSV